MFSFQSISLFHIIYIFILDLAKVRIYLIFLSWYLDLGEMFRRYVKKQSGYEELTCAAPAPTFTAPRTKRQIGPLKNTHFNNISFIYNKNRTILNCNKNIK